MHYIESETDSMQVFEAIKNRRTIRKYKQEKIERSILEKLIEGARLAASAANMQPLKYILVDDPEQVKETFKYVKWANYIAPEGNPKPGEEPVAYIAILIDTEIKKAGNDLDAGMSAQNIQLAAWEEGIGTCCMGAIDRNKLKEVLGIPDQYVLNLIIALGYPAESSMAEDENGSIKYYKDETGMYHVPKRRMKDILFYNRVE